MRALLRGPLGLPIKIALTALLVAIVLLQVDVRQLTDVLTNANLALIGATVALGLFAWVLNSIKLQQLLLLYRLRHRLSDLFRLNLVALFYGLVLPSQLTSEVVKAVRLGRASEERVGAYAAIALDRVTGLVALAAVGVAGLLLAPPPGPEWGGRTPSLMLLAVVTALGAAALLIPAILGRARATRLGRRWTSGRVATTVDLIAEARHRFGWASMASVLVLSLFFQILVVLINWVAGEAVGVPLSPLAYAWIVAVVTLVQLLPITILGFGLREVTYIGLLAQFGVPPSAAVSIALVTFGQYLALGLIGRGLDALARPPAPDGMRLATATPSQRRWDDGARQ
jgi:uncharacterized membrane protein YbhN (UPF0104 family)